MALLEEKEAQLSRSRSSPELVRDVSMRQAARTSTHFVTGTSSNNVLEENISLFRDSQQTVAPSSSHVGKMELSQDCDVAGHAKNLSELNTSKSNTNSSSSLRIGDGRSSEALQMFQDCLSIGDILRPYKSNQSVLFFSIREQYCQCFC